MSNQKSETQVDLIDRRDRMTQAKPELAQSYEKFLVSFNRYRKTQTQSTPKANPVLPSASKPKA